MGKKGLPVRQACAIGRASDDAEIYFGESDKKRVKKEYEGWCTSYACSIRSLDKRGLKKKEVRYNDRVLKTTDTKLDYCPDCSNALFWSEKGKRDD